MSHRHSSRQRRTARKGRLHEHEHPNSPAGFSESEWSQSRSGSHAGRGFRFQDRVAAHMAILMWTGALPITAVVPEGLEDVSLETSTAPIHAQVKSRRPDQPALTVAGLAALLSKVWAKHRERLRIDATVRLALILEQYVEGWSETGWQHSLADDPVAVDALRPALAQRGFTDDLDGLFASTSTVVPADMDAHDLKAVAAGLSIEVPAACWSHLHELRIFLGSLADENGVRTAADRGRLTLPSMHTRLERVTHRVDIESLTLALATGVCQHVDFETPIEDTTFYEGVDVVPGHIGAGLVLDRPDLTDDVVAGLDRQRSVLIIGPSGSGKSALAWLSAHCTRDDVLWYRLSRLRHEDVPLVLRLVDGSLPPSLQRVGLVVDGLGRPDTAGWDHLVSEVAHRPGVCMIGTVRHEDLLVVESASRSHQVRPRLDEALAARIYERLSERGLTPWADYREPFTISKGLLLEYTHILTAGERLEATIRSQTAARLRDPQRDHETAIVRLVATAHAWGASIPITRLQQSLGLADEQTRRALARLVEEHVIRITSGTAEGLHELRSRALVASVHDPPPPTLPETVNLVLDNLDADQLQTYITRVLDEGVMSDAAIIERAADIITLRPAIATLTAVVRALRAVWLRRIAREWAQIIRASRVPEPAWELVALLAVGEVTPPEPIMDSVRAAVSQLRRANARLPKDLREDILDQLSPKTLADIWENAKVPDDASQLLEAFRGSQWPRLTDAAQARLGTLAGDASADELARLLAAAGGLSTNFAAGIAARMGGEDAIVRRLLSQTPWLETLRVETDEEGKTSVLGDVLFVSSAHLPDPHAYVVEVCHLVLACFPSADEAAIRAIDPARESAGYRDFTLAEKRIPRSNLPMAGQVALNRERIDALITVASHVSQTERLIKEREVLQIVAEVLHSGIDEWLRQHPMSPPLASKMEGLERLANNLPLPVRAALRAERSADVGTATWGLARSVTANLIPRLFDPEIPPRALVGYVGDNVRSTAERLSRADAWEPLSQPPTAVASQIVKDLSHLHAILAEMAEGGDDARRELTRISREAKGSVLEQCAGRAHRLASARVKRQIGQLVRQLRVQGYGVTVAQRAARQAEFATWPPIEIAVLVPVPTVGPTWDIVATAVAAVARTEMGSSASIVVAPSRAGKVIASEGQRIITDRFPAYEDVTAWAPNLPLPLLDESHREAFASVVSAIVERSALLRLASHGRALSEPEQRAVDDADSRIASAATSFEVAVSALDAVLADEVRDYLRRLLGKLQQETATVAAGGQVTESIAAQFTSAIARSTPSDLVGTFALLNWALVEYAVSPDGAIERVLQDAATRQNASVE